MILSFHNLSDENFRLWGLEHWNLVHTWTVGRCIVYTGIRLLLHTHPFISSFFFLSNFLTLKFFVTLFSGTVRPRKLKLGTHVDAAYLSLYFSFFFLSNFQTWKFFVTLFSGIVRPRRFKLVTHMENVRPRRLKLGTHVDSGQLYRVYRSQATVVYSCLYSFFFLSNFQTLKFFVTLFSGTVRPRRLKLGTHLDSGQMNRVHRNQAAAAYSSLYFSFFFLSNFQTLKFLSHFSQELWGLEGLNLLHTWKMGGCIMYIGIMLLLLFVPLFFFLSNFQTIKIFCHTFLRNCEA